MRGQSGRGGRDHPARGRGRAGRGVDRGRHGRSGAALVRSENSARVRTRFRLLVRSAHERHPLSSAGGVLLTLPGWVHRHQQLVIENLVEEHRVLQDPPKGPRPRWTDAQRRRPAATGPPLGRREPGATIVTPDTIRRGYRRLLVRKGTLSRCARAGQGSPTGDLGAHGAHGPGEPGVGLDAHALGAPDPGAPAGPGGRSCGLTGVRSWEPAS